MVRPYNGGRYMVPDLGSSRGESTVSKIGFSPGNVEDRMTRRTERTTGLMVRYEIMKVSRLLSGEALYLRVATLKLIRLWIGSQW